MLADACVRRLGSRVRPKARCSVRIADKAKVIRRTHDFKRQRRASVAGAFRLVCWCSLCGSDHSGSAPQARPLFPSGLSRKPGGPGGGGQEKGKKTRSRFACSRRLSARGRGRLCMLCAAKGGLPAGAPALPHRAGAIAGFTKLGDPQYRSPSSRFASKNGPNKVPLKTPM